MDRPALDDWLTRAAQLTDPVCEERTCDRPGDWEAWHPGDTDPPRNICETHAKAWQAAGWTTSIK